MNTLTKKCNGWVLFIPDAHGGPHFTVLHELILKTAKQQTSTYFSVPK